MNSRKLHVIRIIIGTALLPAATGEVGMHQLWSLPKVLNQYRER